MGVVRSVACAVPRVVVRVEVNGGGDGCNGCSEGHEF